MTRATQVLTAGYGAMVAFHIALAAGAPLGRAAWGGTHAHLTTGERVGSALSAAFFAGAIAVVRRRATGRAGRLYRWGTWTLTGLLALSVVANIASSSRWENFLLAPAAVALCVLTGVVARAPTTAADSMPAEHHGGGDAGALAT